MDDEVQKLSSEGSVSDLPISEKDSGEKYEQTCEVPEKESIKETSADEENIVKEASACENTNSSEQLEKYKQSVDAAETPTSDGITDSKLTGKSVRSGPEEKDGESELKESGVSLRAACYIVETVPTTDVEMDLPEQLEKSKQFYDAAKKLDSDGKGMASNETEPLTNVGNKEGETDLQNTGKSVRIGPGEKDNESELKESGAALRAAYPIVETVPTTDVEMELLEQQEKSKPSFGAAKKAASDGIKMTSNEAEPPANVGDKESETDLQSTATSVKSGLEEKDNKSELKESRVALGAVYDIAVTGPTMDVEMELPEQLKKCKPSFDAAKKSDSDEKIIASNETELLTEDVSQAIVEKEDKTDLKLTSKSEKRGLNGKNNEELQGKISSESKKSSVELEETCVVAVVVPTTDVKMTGLQANAFNQDGVEKLDIDLVPEKAVNIPNKGRNETGASVGEISPMILDASNSKTQVENIERLTMDKKETPKESMASDTDVAREESISDATSTKEITDGTSEVKKDRSHHPQEPVLHEGTENQKSVLMSEDKTEEHLIEKRDDNTAAVNVAERHDQEMGFHDISEIADAAELPNATTMQVDKSKNALETLSTCECKIDIKDSCEGGMVKLPSEADNVIQETVPTKIGSSTGNVIEIDDEDDNEGVKTNDTNAQDVDRKQESTNFNKDKGQEMTVIEIDDDEEDEEMPLASQTIFNGQNKNASNGEIEKKQENKNMDVNLNGSSLARNDQDAAKVEASNAVKVILENDKENLLKETAPRAASPIADDGDDDKENTIDEVFYKKECICYDCPRKHKQYFRAPQYIMNHYKISKKSSKPQFICTDCLNKALDLNEEYLGLLAAKQPLLLRDIGGGRTDFVEIIDSSDEDEVVVDDAKEQEQPCLSKNVLRVIEDELENSIKNVLQNLEIQTQLTWSKTILSTRVKKIEEEAKSIDDEIRALTQKADSMHFALYNCPKIDIRDLPPWDLNTERQYVAETDIPAQAALPYGEVIRPPIKVNEIYYAVKNKAIASWVPCKVLEQVETGVIGATKNVSFYKIKYLKTPNQMLKTLSAKHLAYYEPPEIRLFVGARVIAYFDASTLSSGKEKAMIQSAFYPGIIAEPLKSNNGNRYLIFYDDGYTQYVYHKDVRLVCNVSENVWEDVHPASREFIQNYVKQYSINRPMVQAELGQVMTAESNGKWISARVVDIDCSLIKMQFDGIRNHTEWIYRGSLRLGPVFKENHKVLQKAQTTVSRVPRRTVEPYIRYTRDDEAVHQEAQQQIQQKEQERQQQEEQQEQQQKLNTNVAKKSVCPRPEAAAVSTPTLPTVPVVRHLNNSVIYVEDETKPKGKVVFYTAKRNLPPLLYKPHQCSPRCLFKIAHNLSGYSPLAKPLLSGWERLIFRQKTKKFVFYRAPCGKIVRHMKELHVYLRITENVLNVDHFDFSPDINCLAEYVIETAIVQRRDISNGQEKMPIPLVNYYDHSLPPYCEYSAHRIPTEGVNLNLDENFLAGCDCEDDCSDKEKCSCWQLTYDGAKYAMPGKPLEEVGYQYKRLYEFIQTGIYECNSRCKCKQNCLNRVVQQPLQMKLQVFKTSNRGWGLRCINDISKGSFICVYAGHLLTESKANEGGLDAGDEYFAELDYIEVAEQVKEGYESDVESDEDEYEPEDEEDYRPDMEDDFDYMPSKSRGGKEKLLRSNRHSHSEEDSQERQVINFNPNADLKESSVKANSIRKLFGKDETCYIMDAKVIGNLGRYFNHSCSPNLFVQNVFVDTHDLRFPWVAFFASSNIRAGTELTWNYNYEVGVVPGKVLYCQCGAPNCRLRLL